MIGNPEDRQDHCKMATLVKIGLLYVVIGTAIIGNGNASVVIHHQDEDLRTMMIQQSEKTDYFGVTERVTPVVVRIPKNSSEPSKEIAPHTTQRLPKIVDFVLRRQKRSLRMRLHRMGDVIGSHTRVEWTTEGEVMESRVLSAKCEYHGKVDGMENSLATIDLCNDMKGVIRTDDEDIYLQPILQSSTDRHGDHGRYKETHNGRDNETHVIRVHRRRSNQSLRSHARGAAVIDLTRDTSQKDDDVNHRMDGSEEWSRRTRAKRQALHRGPRYMQVLLVTDGSLVRFHGRDLIEQYLLTQMSIVDNIYHHPSLGFEINLIVVKIKILDDSLVRRVVSKGDGKTSLDHFCQWANEEKPKNKNKDEDFDVAVYITKEEIGPAGYAPVTGMCNPIRSCALVKDDGTSSAFVIAHEIGHIFGMIHDGHGNDCSDDPSDGKIMASMVQSNYHTYYWSPCNKVAMEKYLVDVHCLDDKPRDPSWPVYSQPFGQSWSLDEQCRQEFGSGFSLCRAFDHLDPCYHLWCSHSSNQTLCKTKRGPPLPGTSCGRGKWCMNGSCLEKRTVLVDGGWSAWQKWEACSRTCGVGIQFRVRSCTQPRPKHGGRDCRGDREEFRTCNIQPCSQFSDIREEQCTEFNVKRFDQGRRHNWVPMDNKNASEMCKMTCVSMETGAMFVSESNAIDGTFCSYDQPHHVCVKGTCHPVGCDGVLNSRQRDDQCGQCGGSGSTCKRVTGVFTEPLSKMEYHRILVVPAKARNIAIRELHSTHHLAHFIAVRDTATERWYLNGNTQQGPSKQFVAHGTGFTYSTKQREGETLTAKGPLLASVDIMIYSMSTKLPPSLHYEYTIPPEVTQGISKKITATGGVEPELSRYVWAVSGWTNCSKPCGSGGQFEVFTCVDTEKRQYSDGFCSYLSKPKEARKDCNTHPCGLYTFWWDAEDWSNVVTCSASCGVYGVQHRRVQCVTDNRGQIKAVEPAYCDQRALPIYTQPCNRFPCTTPEVPPTIPWESTTTEGTVRTGSVWSPTQVTTPETTILQRTTSQGHRISESVAATLSSGFTRSSNSGSTQYGSTQHFENAPSTEKPRGDSTTESSFQSSIRSRPTTTTFLEVLTSAALPEVHGNVISAISRLSLEGQNRLEQVPDRNGPSTDRRQVVESTRATTFKSEASQSETVPSSTVRRFSLEEDELLVFNRNLEGTTPRIRTPHAPSFESEDFDDFSSSSESDIELELFVERATHRNGDQERNIPRPTTSALEVSPPFQPVDPPVIRINRNERRRLKLGGKNGGAEHERLLSNYENEKDVYGKEAKIVTNDSVRETVRRPDPTSTPPTSTTFTPKAAAKPSIITKSTTSTPTSATAATTKQTTSTTIAATAKAHTRNTISPTPITTTASAYRGIPRSNAAIAKAPTPTTQSIFHSTMEESIPTNPPFPSRLGTTEFGASSIVAVRPMKAKTTVRKQQRKLFSNFYVQPIAVTQTIRDEGVALPKLKMIAVESIQRSFPTTTAEPPPSDLCSSDRSILFCQAGANQDRCSKPTFYSLCCVSCRAYFSL